MAVDFFLKIDGIEGESQDSKHTKEIQLESFSFGVTQTGSFGAGGGGGAGKANFQDFHFVMPTCKAGPKLYLACANGKHIPKAILTARKAGETPQDYCKWTFTDLLVSSYSTSGHGGGDLPHDAVSLNYAQLEVSYQEQKKDGSLDSPVTAGWNLKKQEKV